MSLDGVFRRVAAVVVLGVMAGVPAWAEVGEAPGPAVPPVLAVSDLGPGQVRVSELETVPDWSVLLGGRWRMADGRACGAFGTASFEGSTIRFEWWLRNGGLNVAVERIDEIQGSVVYTTVLSDVGTPRPEVGQRVRYEFGRDRWVSENLRSHERSVHLRC